MKIIGSTPPNDIATVYLGQFESGKMVEFVESVQPPLPREKKWVLIISTLFGCPVRCQMCDAGHNYRGKLSAKEIFAQVDYLVAYRFPSGRVDSDKFKIQFARMGDPALNPAVLDVLENFPSRYEAPTFLPSISSVAPAKTDEWFERLLDIKTRLYPGIFQMQFSIHTTNLDQRERLIPMNKWSFDQMASYGERFFKTGDRKIGLNFALAEQSEMDADLLLKHFDPAIFMIKVTPLNPTYRAEDNQLSTYIDPNQPDKQYAAVESVRRAGYEVVLNIGEVSENQIGSNCGQYVEQYMKASQPLAEGYTQPFRELALTPSETIPAE